MLNPEKDTVHHCPDCEDECECREGEEDEMACTHCPFDEDDEWDDEEEGGERGESFDDDDED